ncbi:TadE/TadG family type IV pilus assembly protein [Brachybacterium sp. YJGR34]|uniref:TadE/TadG family type IV pilus assembly protein n=1 Tax=Brachybacterium sp. YJGR34 TaxID=2059911 RepID=UPI000E0A94DB|nr:TadE family protein [Brachybacterium sp. YJGR34]
MTWVRAEGPSQRSAPQRCRPPDRRGRHPGRRAQLERGSSAESIIVIPTVFVIVFLIIQVGIWAHARSIAVHSAREGATAAATYQSNRSSTEATTAALAENADGVLRDYTVTSSQTDQTITVTVRGRALSLIPLYELPAIEQTVTIPTEHYVP